MTKTHLTLFTKLIEISQMHEYQESPIMKWKKFFSNEKYLFFSHLWIVLYAKARDRKKTGTSFSDWIMDHLSIHLQAYSLYSELFPGIQQFVKQIYSCWNV